LEITWARQLRTLPKEIGNLPNLVTLEIFGSSGITKLPSSIGGLRNLVEFDSSETGVVQFEKTQSELLLRIEVTAFFNWEIEKS